MREQEQATRSMWTSRSYPFREDMAFQQKDWRVERIGWCVMGLLVVLACLGLFSDGPLSATTAHDEARQLTVEHERFYRYGAASDMRWKVPGTPGTETTIAVGQPFLEAFTLETVTPTPSRMSATPDGIQMTFSRQEGSSLEILLALTPDKVGRAAFDIRLQGTQPVRISTFIYP